MATERPGDDEQDPRQVNGEGDGSEGGTEDLDEVEEQSEQSFPASDPPSYYALDT